jgi:outer membrane lipoprotein LolB
MESVACKWVLWGFLLSILSACAIVPMEIVPAYSSKARLDLYELAHWEFDGRLAIADQNDSWSASIIWGHSPTEDELKLAGPLGQGAVIIKLSGNKVMVDRGDGDVRWSDRSDEFVSHELGVFVPVRALRYWVVGLPEPSLDFQEVEDGFRQGGWHVAFKKMQSIEGRMMPQKIAIINDEVKLKLFIDHWNLTDVKTK